MQHNIQSSDAALTQKLQELNQVRTRGSLMRAGGIAAIVIGAIVCLTGNLILGIVLVVGGIVLVFLGGSNRRGAIGAVKQLLGEHLLPPILDQVFDDWTHTPGGRLSDSILFRTDMGFGRFNTISGSDHIQAVYKGVQVQMCDLLLEQVETETVTTTDDDGNTTTTEQESRVTAFHGQWMVCDFGRPLAADLLLTELSGIFRSKKRLMTENEEFNKKFQIHTADDHTAFYVLTPHMMEYLLEMDRKANGRTNLRFCSSGQVHVAIHTCRDLFESDQAKSEADIARVRQTYTDELRYYTDLIDELLNNKRLFAGG